MDQFQWTQHEKFWREDFRRARDETGINHLRYAFPWHVLEPEPGKFDWTYSDRARRRMPKARHQSDDGCDALRHADLVKAGGGRSGIPRGVGTIHRALVSRYRAEINVWCPFNEPLVSALFSGDFGFWPPHSRKWRGYMPVLSRIVQAVSRGIRAIRRVMPEATVLLCDAVENYKTRHEKLQTEVSRRNMRRFLVMDLLTGRVDANHPLYSWLTSYGLSEIDLNWFKTHPQAPDVLGLDYYPHSDWQLDLNGERVRQTPTSPWGFMAWGPPIITAMASRSC